MISRLSTLAAAFAVLVTASLAYAAGSHQSSVAAAPSAAKQVHVVQLERVVVVGKRLAQ